MTSSQTQAERPARPHAQSKTTIASEPTYVGGVTVSGPNRKGYYRLRWTEPDGSPGDTSGSRDQAYAVAKAHEINDRIAQAAGPKATYTLQHVVDAFLADGHSPYKKKLPYKRTQLDGLRTDLTRALRGQEYTRAMDVDRKVCDTMRQQAGTHNGVAAMTSAVRAMLRWGYQHQYFTAEQAELLPRGGALPEPIRPSTRTRVAADDAVTTSRARSNGSDEEYVDDEDCPNAEQIENLRDQLQKHFPLWGALACELAANSGPRWGEEFQLKSTDVHLEGCARYRSPHIHVDWQIAPTAKAGEDRKGNRRDRPKGNKTRVIPIAERSITGYPLRDVLRERVAAARAEKVAGTNPEGLLFPAERGGLLWHTSFYGDHLLPAMIDAGLPVETWEISEHVWDDARRAYVLRTRTERHAVFSWHSLRHRFARICVDMHHMPEGKLMAIGGWENINTVQTRYYRSGDDNMNGGLACFD